MSSFIINSYRYAVPADTVLMSYYDWHPAWSSIDIASGFSLNRVQANSTLGGGTGGSSAAEADDGDYMEQYVNLEPGTYTMTYIYNKNTSGALVDVSFNGVALGTVDHYNGTSTVNHVVEYTGITVGSSGNYLVRFRANGKNASSSDYRIINVAFGFTRTGA